MARPTRPRTQTSLVSGNPARLPDALAASVSMAHPGKAMSRATAKQTHRTERRTLAHQWQVEAYRHVNICGEARFAVTVFAAMAARAEIGVSEPQALGRKAVWVNEGPEVEAFATLAGTNRERSKLIRDYMTHRIIAGDMYLVGRPRQPNDAEYETRPNDPVWEIVAVTEVRKMGSGAEERWEVRYDNDYWVPLSSDDPVLRMWTPDPENRREAWSPFRSLLPVLREIEWSTKHLFTQIRSRLIAAGVWFIPDNITFPEPPPSAVDGGAETLSSMNEAERFMVALAASGMQQLDADETAFPTIVMADPLALQHVDQSKLIQFWSEIDDKAMVVRSDNIRRFALGMDLPPERVIGATGVAVSGSGGSAGSANHWSLFAIEEQTIIAHVEPALDDLCGELTIGFLRSAVPGTDKVIGYNSNSLRLKQDRSKEALEWYDRGVLKAEVALRETGFDPSMDQMDDAEFRKWLLVRIAGGSATPEQVQAALTMLGTVLPVTELPESEASPGISDANGPRSLKDHPYEGPPRVDHEHNDAQYTALVASCEGLVLRALEKAGNRLLNDGKRGRDRDRDTPPYLAHLKASLSVGEWPEFDFSTAHVALDGFPAKVQERITKRLGSYCRNLYVNQRPHSREELTSALDLIREEVGL